MQGKILAAEDDAAARRLVSHTLGSAGYRVVSAVNRLEGLRKAQQEAPDLVVLDAMLPGIDGFEVCHRLGSSSAAPRARLPILMLTARSQEADRAVGEKVGADSCLPKPATPGETTAAVRSLLASRKEGDA